MKKIIFFSFLPLLFILSCNLLSNNDFSTNRVDISNSTTNNTKGWLLMIYISGTGTLEEESITDINNIKDGYMELSEDNQNDIDIVILHDRGVGYSTSENNWTGTYLYRCGVDGLEAIESVDGWRDSIDQEENMGSIETLDQFIDWSLSNYRHPKNSLIIWNHGGGLGGQFVERAKAVSWDTENINGVENDALYINEIESTIRKYFNNNTKLDLLGFDACYMAMIEIAYEFRNCVDYIVASPGIEIGGWRYKEFLKDLSKETTPKNLSEYIVLTYKDFSLENNLHNSLISLELLYIEEVKKKIDTLSEKLITYEYSFIKSIRDGLLVYYDDFVLDENILYPYVDLGFLMDLLTTYPELENDASNVITTMKKLIISSFTNNRGLSIFFSDSQDSYTKQGWYTPYITNTFGGVDFCNDFKTITNWKTVMDHFFCSKESI